MSQNAKRLLVAGGDLRQLTAAESLSTSGQVTVTGFDRFGPLAAHGAEGITETAAANRAYLCRLMLGAGFEPYSAEWWHYTLKNEPFPDTYFDFEIV